MAQDFFEKADLFFNDYLAEGLVKYEAIKKKTQALNELTAEIASYPLEDMSNDSKKAFLINAYNLLVIKQIIENYPVEGPLEVKGFFNEKNIRWRADR